MIRLNTTNLARLPKGITPPAYARAGLSPGIVHIGCGNFHRAHQAVYLDDLFALGLGHDFAILGAGVRPADAGMRDQLCAQDYLSTVIELAPGGAQTARIIGAMTGFVPVAKGNAALIAAMAEPAIKIVSLTVTEGGYYIDPTTGTFSPAHPDVQADAANPDAPDTAFGAIIAALRLRRSANLMPFTVMCCDNIPHNGHVTRDAVVGLCRLSDPLFADWIAQNVAFPNSMVDRITPATGTREIALAAAMGIDDAAPVTCEPFRQWVMEDNFPAGRPELERVGVTFTPHVDLYETMKIRILNGGHAIIAYPAGLQNIEFAHQAMADPLIRAFLDRVLGAEVLPHVPAVPGQNLEDYKRLIIERFSNPKIADTVRRLCLDGSNRQPKFILPALQDGLAAGTDVAGLTLLSAIWCRYCFGTTEDGFEIPANDPNWQQLTKRANAARTAPVEWLKMTEVYGDIADNAAFVASFSAALQAVWQDGSKAAINAYLSRQ
ncbi:MAG: mannitol dehydrogenase family protein [Albidovulum sp.]